MIMQKAVLMGPSLRREEKKKAQELYTKLKLILEKLEVKLEKLEHEKKAEFKGLSSTDILVVQSGKENLLDKIDFGAFKKLKGMIMINPSREDVERISEIGIPKLLIGSSKVALENLEKDIAKFFKKIF